ncbi:MAG: tetratricopeptide repeat protein [Thermodesulfobacteriota bacterium]
MRKAEFRKKTGWGGAALCARLSVFLCLVALCAGILLPSSCRADLVDLLAIPALVPERDVSLDSGAVAWKKTWDEARFLTRTGDFPGAERKYEIFLALKNNIELARWEYGCLLLRIGNWQKAAATMEILVEKAPEQVAYLNALGLALRKLGQFSRALDLFSKAYENDADNLLAMAGMAQGLVEVGRKKEAFPLFAKILVRRPDDRSIHRSLANLAFELGKLETARKLMLPLVRSKDVDLDTLLMTARIYEKLKQDKTATTYWRRCLKHDSANREARGRLALYFEKSGQAIKAMPHLLALLENDPLNASLLSRICRIYLLADHFAEARPYFERYVLLQPDKLDGLMPVTRDKADFGSDAISLYRRLLDVTPDDLVLLDSLANDLLLVGDTETALFMWEHVARLYPDRIEVYQEIVDLLERLGRDEKLAETLEVLHRLAPGEMQVVSKLANLKVARGDLLVGLEYYNKLEKAGYEGLDLFEGRGPLYEDLDRLAPALADYKRLLVMQPNRPDIRRRCIALAGKLGENVFLGEQVTRLDATIDPENRDSDLLLIGQAFADAYDFDQARMRYQRLIISRTESAAEQNGEVSFDPLVRRARLGLAELYLTEGQVFEAEQVLREIFLAGGGEGEVLARLFDLALVHNNHKGEDAGVWLARYASLNGGSVETILMQARLLSGAGDYDGAEDLLERFLYDSVTGNNPSAFTGRKGEVLHQAGLLLAEIFIKSNDLAKAEQQCLAMLRSEQDRAVQVLLQKIYDRHGNVEAAANIFKQLLDDADDNFELLGLAGLFQQYGLPASQVATAEKVLVNTPGSLAAAFFMADGLVVAGKGRDAIKLLEDMAKIYPGNNSIILMMARYCYLGGQYASVLQHCDRFLERNPGRLDAHLLKAQALTALGEYESAENMIKHLFPVKTAVVLEKNVSETGIKVTLPPAKKTFLQLLTFSVGKPLSVARELMSARHLVDNSIKAKRELNSIAVPLYVRYRWEQEFRKVVPPG